MASVSKGDIAVTLNALGTVTPLRNVTVSAQVAGQLMGVAFKEGQLVKEGDLVDLGANIVRSDEVSARREWTLPGEKDPFPGVGDSDMVVARGGMELYRLRRSMLTGSDPVTRIRFQPYQRGWPAGTRAQQ